MKNRFNKKVSMGVVIFAIVSVLALTVAFATLSQTIKINGTSTVKSGGFNITIENLTASDNGSAVTTTGTTVSFSANFKKPGDSVEVNFDIVNNGTIDATGSLSKFDSPTCKSGTSSVTCPTITKTLVCGSTTITGTGENTVLDLDSGDSVSCKLTVTLDSSLTSLPSTQLTVSNLGVEFTYVQAEESSSGGETPTYTMATSPSSVSTSADATFTSEAELSTLDYVEVDGEEIDSSNYTATSGSTIITLKREYLATLSSGDHSIKIVSEGGYAEASFSVVEITDLTGTKWIGNDTMTYPGAATYSVNSSAIDYNGDSCEGSLINFNYIKQMGLYYFHINGCSFNSGLSSYGSSDTTTLTKAVDSPADGVIHFTGGTDATNATLIAWLKANGTLSVE